MELTILCIILISILGFTMKKVRVYNRLRVSIATLTSSIPLALAAPVYIRSASSSDRDSTWQVLADGTQDLAALIGLFATDSVERYAVDYSRGYIRVAMATCSMLGILGYVRALIKLGIGLDACVSAAFPSAPVRPVLGVPEEDTLPNDDLITVTYIARSEHHDSVVWETIKAVRHTRESMPLTWVQRAVASEDLQPHLLLVEAGPQDKHLISGRSTPGQWQVVVALVATAGINSFVVLFVSKGWPWTKVMAAYGMFGALFTASVMWAFVYTREQVPIYGNYKSVFLDRTGELHRRACGRVTLREERRNAEFAFIEGRGVYTILPCTALRKGAEYVVRSISIACAILITLGYLCQYIVIRQSSKADSLKWLLIHGGLTILRAVVWMIPTSLGTWCTSNGRFKIPSFERSESSFSSFQASSGTIFGSRIISYPSITELELAIYASSFGVLQTRSEFPKAMLLRLRDESLLQIFKQAFQMNAETIEKVKAALKDPGGQGTFWDFPPRLFRKFLYQRSESDELKEIRDATHIARDDWGCRVLHIGDGAPWEGGEIIFVPLVRLSYKIDGLDADGHAVGNAQVFQGWSTCFSKSDYTVNMICHESVSGEHWTDFDTPWDCPAPERRIFGQDCTQLVVSAETGESGDVSVDSELTVDGYTNRWPALRKGLKRGVRNMAISARDGPNRVFIQFCKNLPPVVEEIVPNVTGPVLDAGGNQNQIPLARMPRLTRLGQNGSVVITQPRGGLLSNSDLDSDSDSA